MARTLIGQLILRLRTDGLGEAKKLTDTMRDVENAARRMGAQGVASWGTSFQRNIDKLKLTNDEIGKVQSSWIALHDNMRSRNIGSALRASEISHWKTNTISTLAQTRGEMDRHFAEAERAMAAHSKRATALLRPALVALGAYTAPYFAGVMGAHALTASSERRREVFRQEMASIPENEREQIFSQADSLSQQFPSVPITSIMEMARTARNTMGDTERGLRVLEEFVKGFVTLQSTKGTDAAVSELDGLIRGIDNLGLNSSGEIGIENTIDIVQGMIRAAQIEGRQLDVGTLFQFARRSKIAGPGLSTEFVAGSSPAFMQDMTPEGFGSALSSAYQAFVIGSNAVASKQNIANQRAMGLRTGDGNGQLVGSELFGTDPYAWVKAHLVPALENAGVDMESETAIGQAVAQLSRNTHATGLLTRMVTQREQADRLLELYSRSLGTDVAEDVRYNDPFVGWEAFKKSLENLSAALIPIDHINAGINKLADGINKLASVANDNSLLTAMGIGGAAYGAYAGGRWTLGKLSDAFGLKSSAVALDASAAALTRAAVALGGSAATDGLPDGPDRRRGGGGRAGLGAAAVGLATGAALAPILLGDTPGATFEDQVARQRQDREALEAAAASARDQWRNMTRNPAAEIGAMVMSPAEVEAERRDRLGSGAAASRGPDSARFGDPITPQIDTATAMAEVQAANAELSAALQVKGTAVFDSSALDVALAKARQLLSMLSRVGEASAAAAVNVDAEMRRNFTD